MNRNEAVTLINEVQELGAANGCDMRDKLIKLISIVEGREREACAKVCESLGMATNGMYARNHECATTIRARSNQ